jgi:hypothetical protein
MIQLPGDTSSLVAPNQTHTCLIIQHLAIIMSKYVPSICIPEKLIESSAEGNHKPFSTWSNLLVNRGFFSWIVTP